MKDQIICSFYSLLLSYSVFPFRSTFSLQMDFLKEMGVSNSEGVMTLGQVSEIFFLLTGTLFFPKLGVKKMLMIGMLLLGSSIYSFCKCRCSRLMPAFYLEYFSTVFVTTSSLSPVSFMSIK